MNATLEVQSRPSTAYTTPGLVPTLIRVPALPAARRVGTTTRRRRRLRREVKVAGTALLFGIPMAWSLLAFGPRAEAGRSEIAPAVVAAPAADDGASMVTISLESDESRPPVLLQAVVPADGAEEAASHAGG